MFWVQPAAFFDLRIVFQSVTRLVKYTKYGTFCKDQPLFETKIKVFI